MDYKLFVLLQPNAAGLKYQALRKRWQTNVTSHSVANTHVPAFKGDYTLKIKINGNVIETKHFTTSSHTQVDVTVSGTGKPLFLYNPNLNALTVVTPNIHLYIVSNIVCGGVTIVG